MRGAAPVHGQPRPVLTQPVTSPGDPFRGWRIDSSGGTCFSRSKPGIYPGKARQGPGTGRRRERARPMVTERSYPGEAADPYCLRPGEAEKLLAGHPWRRFAVLGDSVAEGAGEPAPGYADEPWCDRIAAALRAHQPDLAYLNLGVGNTSAAQVRATQLPTALVFAPDLALVACGGYDILQSAYDPAAVSAEIRAIVSALAGRGARVITMGLFDRSYSPAVPEQFRQPLQERIHSLSQSTREIAKDLGHRGDQGPGCGPGKGRRPRPAAGWGTALMAAGPAGRASALRVPDG